MPRLVAPSGRRDLTFRGERPLAAPRAGTHTRRSRGPRRPATGETTSTDLTIDTLDDLRRCLEASVTELTAAFERVAELQELRAAGNPWSTS